MGLSSWDIQGPEDVQMNDSREKSFTFTGLGCFFNEIYSWFLIWCADFREICVENHWTLKT